jgi:hypothetical protein
VEYCKFTHSITFQEEKERVKLALRSQGLTQAQKMVSMKQLAALRVVCLSSLSPHKGLSVLDAVAYLHTLQSQIRS